MPGRSMASRSAFAPSAPPETPRAVIAASGRSTSGRSRSSPSRCWTPRASRPGLAPHRRPNGAFSGRSMRPSPQCRAERTAMTDATETFEIKATPGPGGDVADRFEQFLTTFEAFKEGNEQRIKEIERRGTADTVTEDKLARLNTALDSAKTALERATLERARPRLEGSDARPSGTDEYKDAFAAYVKRGEEKALSVGSNPDGGYLVPTETETQITSLLTAISPIRSIASVRQVSSSIYRKPITTTGPVVGWAAETGSRTQTNSQVIDAVAFPTAELYAMPAATTAFLDDAAVDVGSWIAEEVNAA